MARRVDFLFDPDWPDVGSTVMRGRQLSELARHTFGRGWRIRYLPLGARVQGSDVFLTKNAARRLDVGGAAQLIGNGNRLFVDIVDSEAPSWVADAPCTIVTASMTSFDEASRALPAREVVLVNHHTDPRIPAPPARRETFRIGYFGEPFNAMTTPRIAERVEVIPVSTLHQTTAWFERLAEFPMHYAVRTRIAQDAVKPFLKGFTAAVSHANILAMRSDPEAVAWLGADYPYLVDSVEEHEVLTMIDRAASDFGTPAWRDALEVMAGIRARVAPTRIAAELRRALA